MRRFLTSRPHLISPLLPSLSLHDPPPDAWLAISGAAQASVEAQGLAWNLSVSGFATFTDYDDALTLALVVAAANALSVPVSAVLKIYGGYLVSYFVKNGYQGLLSVLGSNLFEFLNNLDFLHAHLQKAFPKARFPHFSVRDDDDGTYFLHYFSYRKGLSPIVEGLVIEIAKALFNTVLTLNVVKTEENTALGETVVFQFSFEDKAGQESSDNENKARHVAVRGRRDNFSATAIEQLGISTEGLLVPWPWHVILDENMEIVSVGPSLVGRHFVTSTGRAQPFGSFSQSMEIIRPKLPAEGDQWTYDSIMANALVPFIVRVKGGIELRGQMLPLRQRKNADESEPKKQRGVLFLCSPNVASLEELQTQKLTLADIPLHDARRELVLMHEQRLAEVQTVARLDKALLLITVQEKELKHQHELTNKLLHSMLPPHVASQIMAGKTVKPEHYDSVSIFFSDIVGFTDISKAVKPTEIVTMLNSMYLLMDSIATDYGIVKIETIGDAYMATAGLTEKRADHAHISAAFALAVSRAVHCIRRPDEVARRESMTPADKEKLREQLEQDEVAKEAYKASEFVRIRVGVHEGPVVASVVGNLMPRYCLFGDTVNTASRMESNGQAGSVHISDALYQCLDLKLFKTNCRGVIDVKGKGQMTTHWVEDVLQEDGEFGSKRMQEIIDRAQALVKLSDVSGDHAFEFFTKPRQPQMVVDQAQLKEEITNKKVMGVSQGGKKEGDAERAADGKFGEVGEVGKAEESPIAERRPSAEAPKCPFGFGGPDA